jgi:hypothetical protein
MADSSDTFGAKDWRQSTPRGPGPIAPKASRSRRRRLFGFAVAFVAVAGAIVGFVLLYNPVPDAAFVPLWITEYDDPRIPPNPYAGQGRDALDKLPWLNINAFASQEKDRFVRELQQLKEKPPGDPVAVYLSGYLLAGADGRACLLPGDARLDAPSTWVPMSTILQNVQNCPARHKLLILDVMHPLTDLRLGMLENDAARLLQDELRKAVEGDPNLVILCACFPGQVAHASEDLGQTVFAQYVLEGLQGGADNYNPKGERNRRVTVRELAAFVAARVDRWVEQNRQDRQTPQLFPEEPQDFPLVNCGAPPGEPPAEPEPPEAYPDWLQAGWKLRDGWRADTSTPDRPRRRGELEALLLRLERRWRNGADTEKVKQELARRLEEFRRQGSDNPAAPAPPVVRSVAEAVAYGAKPPDLSSGEVLEKYRSLTQKAAALYQSAKPDEKEKAAYDDERKAFLKGFAGKPFELAWLLLERAADDREPRRDRVRLWDDLLRSDPVLAPALAGYREMDFLRRLGDWAADSKAPWPELQVVREAILAVRDRERAAVCPAWLLDWLGEARTEAGKTWDEAEKRLFDRDPHNREQAGPLVRKASRDYKKVLDQREVLQDACTRRDEALDLLPGYVSYLLVEEQAERDWKNAVQMTSDLDRLLQRPPQRGLGGAERDQLLRRIEGLRNDLSDLLARLRERLAPTRWANVKADPSKARPTDIVLLEAILDSPWPSVEDRTALWQVYRLASAQRHYATQRLDREDNQRAQRTPVPRAPDTPKALARQRRLALARAELSVNLLRLDGAASVSELEPALALAQREPENASAWQALAGALGQAWTKHLAAGKAATRN